MDHLRLFSALLALALLCGCQPFEERQADLILETGGSGGRVLAIDADSCLMGVGTRDGSVRVWGLEHGARHAAWRAHRGTVNGILFLPGDRLLTVGYDGQLALWSTVGRRIGGWSVRMQAWDEVARRGAGIGVVPVMGHFGTSGMTPPKADDSGRQRSRWAIDLSAALAALLKAPAGPAGPAGMVIRSSRSRSPRCSSGCSPTRCTTHPRRWCSSIRRWRLRSRCH
jgi:hypothetical protein